MPGQMYVTAEELKYSSELTGFNFADHDVQLAIQAASYGIEEYCGRLGFGSIADTRYFTPAAGGHIDVDDVISVSTFATDMDGDGVFETSWAYPRDYVLEPLNAPAWSLPYERIRVQWTGSRRFSYWPIHRSIQVIGTFGWPEIPTPIKQATSIMASRLLIRSREAPLGVLGLGVDNVAVRLSKVDPDMCFLLDPFVRGGAPMVA